MRVFHPFLACVIFVLSLSSCEKEQKETPSSGNTGKLMIDGKTYVVDKAQMKIYGRDTAQAMDHPYRLALTFLTSDLSAEEDDYGNWIKYEGGGYSVEIDLLSENELKPAEGIYQYKTAGDSSFTYRFAIAQTAGDFAGSPYAIIVDRGGDLQVTQQTDRNFQLQAVFNGAGGNDFEDASFSFSYSGSFEVVDKR